MKKLILVIWISLLLAGCDNLNNQMTQVNTSGEVAEINQSNEQVNDQNNEADDQVEEESQETVDDLEELAEDIIVFDNDKSKDDYLNELSQLEITLNHDSGRNYLLIFDENKIMVGEVEGEIFSVEFWDTAVIDLEEKSILLHIYEEVQIDEDTLEESTISLDYYSKLMFDGPSLNYYHSINTQDEYLSTWNMSEIEVETVNEIGKIFIYGETHGRQPILDKEFELWKAYYTEKHMRHLFVELSYPKAQLLNLWMSGDESVSLDDLITTAYNPEAIKNYYRKIKEECPETVFHGFDIGKGYTLHGVNYRKYLEENNLEDTQEYALNEIALAQEKQYKGTHDASYREQMIVENFINAFNRLGDEDVMATIGYGHLLLEPLTLDGITFDTMGKQLSDIYQERIQLESLKYVLLDAMLTEPLSVEEKIIGGKTYQAEYYGKDIYTNSDVIEAYEFWKLVDAYDDFKDNELTGDIFDTYTYPMLIEEHQVYLIVGLLSDKTEMTY